MIEFARLTRGDEVEAGTVELIPRASGVRHMLLLFPGEEAALLIGVLVRCAIVLPADFPLVDGGLFFSMVGDLRASHYLLPDVTSYNHAGIPFSYPPLGIYAAALISDLTPLSATDVFRFLPLATEILTLPAFLLLASAILPSRSARVYSLFAFALMPATIYWPIMGGGVTRSLGFLFSILTVHQAYSLYHRGTIRDIVGTAAMAGLTTLSHPTMASATAVGVSVMFLAYGRSRSQLASSILALFIAVAMASPWWGNTLVRHGPAPLLDATGTGGSVLDGLFGLIASSNGWFEPSGWLNAFVLTGAIACTARGPRALTAWWIAVAILEPRISEWAAAVPAALLAGAGVSVLEQLLRTRCSEPTIAATTPSARKSDSRNAIAFLSMFSSRGLRAVPLLMILVASAPSLFDLMHTLTPLPREERTAMYWIDDHVPQGTTFVVISGLPGYRDSSAEWFPALSHRTSAVTHQGYEWLGAELFSERSRAHDAAQLCAAQAADCLDRWSQASQSPFDYVYLSKSQPTVNDHRASPVTLQTSLLNDPRYQRVYEGPGADVFRRQVPVARTDQ